jgi:5-hydroxyisourate hydrolase
MNKSPITTHVLDTSAGRPAAGVAIELFQKAANGVWQRLGQGATNSDGRAFELLAPGSLTTGDYRLTFDTAAYFAQQKQTSFYPSVTIEFHVHAPSEYYHVPLLLSPFGYSTYRGS